MGGEVYPRDLRKTPPKFSSKSPGKMRISWKMIHSFGAREPLNFQGVNGLLPPYTFCPTPGVFPPQGALGGPECLHRTHSFMR